MSATRAADRTLADLLERERALRRQSERQAEERARMLGALRERQALLERLAVIQRGIVDRTPLADVLGTVVEAARELLGDDAAVLRRHGSSGRPGAVVAAAGLEAERGSTAVVSEGGVGERARREKGVVVVDAVSGPDPEATRTEFGTESIRSAIAEPVLDGGEAIGSLAVGSRDAAREYDGRDQQVLTAVAEHAALAFGHATALGEAVHESMHDALTRLPNRTLFVDRLEHAVALAGRTGAQVGVLLCGLDGFKAVNDSLGHASGDELLRAVGRRIVGCLRPTDTVARVGGDEFAILLEELHEPGDAARAARRVLAALEPALELRGRKVYVSASVGVAAGRDAATLFRDADLAMSRAKREGRGRYAISEPRLHSAVAEQLELELDLNRAIESGELELVYQPIFSLRSRTVAGLEALVRWRHPIRGLIAAERFVPLAERSGAIRALGDWVLSEACRQGALWRARYPGFPGLQVGVNVSAVQLSAPELVDEVAAALEAAELEPGGLTLEITETALMEDLDAAAGRLAELKALGVDLAIDDFGRGYASLEYLRRFPLDNLKIDRSFIASLGTDDEDPRLLRAIVDLAEIFDLRPVGEGIERPVEVERLLELGCDLGQGHMLSEPLPAAETDGLLLRAGLLGGPPIPSPPDDAGATTGDREPDRDRGAGAGHGGAAGEPG